MDGCDENPASAAGRLGLVVGAEPPVAHEPGASAPCDPALGQRTEGALPLEPGHDHELQGVLLEGDIFEPALVSYIRSAAVCEG